MSTTIKKNVKFVAAGLGGSFKFTLAIVPPGSETFDKVTPVAWKVFSLKDGDSFGVTWTNTLAGCRATVDTTTSPTATVKAMEYHPIAAKQTSDILLDSAKRPPVYHFTDNAPLTELDRARIVNRTGTKVDAIGAGFITDLNTPGKETMNLVLASKSVDDGNAVYVDHAAVAKLWVSLDYKESQLLKKDVNTVETVWEQDLAKLSGGEVTVAITRDAKGKIVGGVDTTTGGGHKYSSVDPRGKLSAQNALAVTYTANIVFSSPAFVIDGIRALVRSLSDYPFFAGFKSTVKETDTEASLQFRLAPWISPAEATVAVLQVMNENSGTHGQMFLRTHSAAKLLSVSDDGRDHETWMDINPASDAWSGPTAGPFPPIEPRDAQLVDGANGNAAAPAMKQGAGEPAAKMPAMKAFCAPMPLCLPNPCFPVPSGGGGTWNGGNGSGVGGQWNGGNGGGVWNGGNGSGVGGQWNGGNAGGQWNGGNGSGSGGQWNGGNAGGQWNGGNGVGNGGQWNGGNRC
ncbi:hypothetical protein OH77DRAFT_146498 [Trametes cingulata]|nr:hypothetical protein OH77DRAFT_146498 [Trametes cingulata]